jgi:hypothetical protein
MVESPFITARAAARHMIKQRSGVITFVTGGPVRPHVPGATPIVRLFVQLRILQQILPLSLAHGLGSLVYEHLRTLIAGPFRTRWSSWEDNCV